MAKPIKVSTKFFTRLWMDGVPNDSIAETIGCCRKTVTNTAIALSLPPRMGGAKKQADHARIAELYAFGVEIKAIATETGIHWNTVRRIVAKLGLPQRGKGFLAKQPRATVTDFQVEKLARAMAHTAAQEQAQIIIAEMADKVESRYVGARQARNV